MFVTTDPVTLARAAVAALQAGDWAAVAGLCDPVSLRAHQRALVDQYASRDRHTAPTVDEYLRQAPDMPREVAEYHVAQFARHRPDAGMLARELPGIATLDALRAAPAAAVFAAWLEGRSHRGMLRRAVAEGRLSAAAAERQIDPAVPEHDVEILGVVPDGDDVAHVVLRHRVHPATFDDPGIARWLARHPADEQALLRACWGAPPSTQACRRQSDGAWRLVAGHEFLGLGGFSAIVADGVDDDAWPAGPMPDPAGDDA